MSGGLYGLKQFLRDEFFYALFHMQLSYRNALRNLTGSAYININTQHLLKNPLNKHFPHLDFSNPPHGRTSHTARVFYGHALPMRRLKVV
jgi:hypothetical protein